MGSEKFKPSELKNIEEFFETDKDEDSIKSIVYFIIFFRLILQTNYSFDIFFDNKNNKNDLYLFNRDFFYFNFSTYYKMRLKQILNQFWIKILL